MIQENIDKPLSEHVTPQIAQEILEKSQILIDKELHHLAKGGGVLFFDRDLKELIADAAEWGHANGVNAAKEGRE